MTDKSATPDWRKADARELEPYFSKWMLELTAQGLHNKSDIAIVLSILDAELATAKAELEKCRAVLNKARAALIEASPCASPECQQVQGTFIEWALNAVEAALGESK